MPRKPKPSAPAPPNPLIKFVNEDRLRRRAQRLGIDQLRLERDGDELECKLCYDTFGTTGDAAKLVVLHTGVVLHTACAKRACEEQKRRELDGRGRGPQGNDRHRPKAGYYCELTQRALLPREVSALQLEAWPADGEGWASDDGSDDNDDLNDVLSAINDDDVARMQQVMTRSGIEPDTLFNRSHLMDWNFLMWAVEDNKVECARWLIAQGVDVNHTSYEDARFGDDADDLSDDYDPADGDFRDCAVFLAVKTAVKHKDTRVLQLLLDANVDLTMYVEDVDEHSVLLLALDVFETYRGANATTRAKDAFAANLTRLLLRHGAGAVMDKGGPSPLEEATSLGYVETMTVLLDAGANPSYRTPLLDTKRLDSLDEMELLLQRGSNPNGEHGDTSVLSEFLWDASYGFNKPHKLFPKVGRLLADSRTNVNHAFINNQIRVARGAYTPLGQLMTASTQRAWLLKPYNDSMPGLDRGVVQPLLELLLADDRLKVNLPAGPGGETGLMLAVQWTPWAVPMLLRHGDMDINLTDDKGRTALDHLIDKQASHMPLPGDAFEDLERQLTA